MQLSGVSRLCATPRVLDQSVALPGYGRPLPQLTITELGHEQPTVLLTNHQRPSPATLIERHARRMVIENSISYGIEFFHMDALSSTVPMKATAICS